jgi:YgiT-type zinc finger domain-containing protein
MSCDVCAIGERRPQLIQYSVPMAGRLILVDHVPAEVCDRCGEVTLSPDVVERLQQTVWRREPPARFVETAVYDFADCA